MDDKARIDDLVDFWIGDGTVNQAWWFIKSDETDETLRTRFGDLAERAAKGDLDPWSETPRGALALILLLDQLPRNLHRGDPKAFAQDSHARAVARRALAMGHDRPFGKYGRLFFYLPFEHSEILADQDDCLRLVEDLRDPDLYQYAVAHRDIIARFGRFPHRNAVLGRPSTPEELAFLDQPGSSF
ncbi:DUF924 family protein [Magnetospira sp. QH-2]|uniref:DUF924 family protein n=1 Tax=Magnetospira sp. (strain QH-2) TaxID=1288970 RepID=UPI0003E80AE1|nr:DUF924 family protein [Magnetospira sp. QH-2]CCQ75035.1 conserved protein of unknown function (DUF924) [Magnetospira sp. QH-2]